ncbi:hypothetical protein C8J57DRAFT_1252356 [Mycena rebaudengoi]|nr:hypothetical protein C8J57DRAFT_1252356 [Mycena rebaudengoi]
MLEERGDRSPRAVIDAPQPAGLFLQYLPFSRLVGDGDSKRGAHIRTYLSSAMYAPSILDSWILWLILLNVDHPGANASGSKHVEHRRCGEDDGQAPIQRGYLPTQKAERGARDSMHWEARWWTQSSPIFSYKRQLQDLYPTVPIRWCCSSESSRAKYRPFACTRASWSMSLGLNFEVHGVIDGYCFCPRIPIVSETARSNDWRKDVLYEASLVLQHPFDVKACIRAPLEELCHSQDTSRIARSMAQKKRTNAMYARTLALELRMGQSGIIQQMFIWLGVVQGLRCRLHRRGPNSPPRMELGRHSSASLNVHVASSHFTRHRSPYTGYRPAFIYVQELNRHVRAFRDSISLRNGALEVSQHSSVDVAEDDKVHGRRPSWREDVSSDRRTDGT